MRAALLVLSTGGLQELPNGPGIAFWRSGVHGLSSNARACSHIVGCVRGGPPSCDLRVVCVIDCDSRLRVDCVLMQNRCKLHFTKPNIVFGNRDEAEGEQVGTGTVFPRTVD